MTLKETLALLQDPSTAPGQLSEALLYLSADYTQKTIDLTEVLTLKSSTWPKFRTEAGSDKQADKAWDATPEGLREMSLRLEMKSLEKLMSAIKAHLRVRETEARNQF